MALRLLASPLQFLEEVTQQYGKVVGMVLGGERVVLVADSAVAEQILIAGSSNVAKVCYYPERLSKRSFKIPGLASIDQSSFRPAPMLLEEKP